MSTCPCPAPKTTPKLMIAPGCSCSGGTTRTPFECITQTSSFIAPAVGTQASFKVATIAGFYSVGLYLHVFNAAGVAWVGRIVSMIEADTVITLERIDFEGTVAASTNMGLTVCLLNVGAVLPAVAGDCHPFAAKVMTGSWAIPSTGALGTIGISGCWDLNVGQGLFVGNIGWVRVQQILTDTESELTFTYLVVQLLGTAEAGNPVPVNSLVFAAELQVTETAEPVAPTVTNGAMVAKFTAGNIGSYTWASTNMAITFVLPWAAICDVSWRVGQATSQTGTFHKHFDCQLSGGSTALLGAPDNDADISAAMASSNWGRSFVELAAGTYTATIVGGAVSGTPGHTNLDTFAVQVLAHRLTGVTGVA